MGMMLLAPRLVWVGCPFSALVVGDGVIQAIGLEGREKPGNQFIETVWADERTPPVHVEALPLADSKAPPRAQLARVTERAELGSCIRVTGSGLIDAAVSLQAEGVPPITLEHTAGSDLEWIAHVPATIALGTYAVVVRVGDRPVPGHWLVTVAAALAAERLPRVGVEITPIEGRAGWRLAARDAKGAPVQATVRLVAVAGAQVDYLDARTDARGEALVERDAHADALHAWDVEGYEWKCSCEVDWEIVGGLAPFVRVVAPTSSIVESKRLERIPLVVEASDVDNLVHVCRCQGEELESTAIYEIPDTVDYGWTILSSGPQPGGQLESPFGPATLYVPPELAEGATHSAVVQVEVTDGRRNDLPVNLKFFIQIERVGRCKYRSTAQAQPDAWPSGPVPQPKEGSSCWPSQPLWLQGPAMICTMPPSFRVTAGERAVLVATTSDVDALALTCDSTTCAGFSSVVDLADEVKVEWSAGRGTFPDYGGGPPITNGNTTTVVYKAPDRPGHDVLDVVARDSGTAAPDQPVRARAQITICRVFLTVDGVAEDQKVCPGRPIGRNTDDDDEDLRVDLGQLRVVHEDDLVKITVDRIPRDGSVTLSAPLGGDRIRLWDSPTKNNPVSLPLYIPPGELPKKLWVEGTRNSAEMGDVMLAAEMTNPAGRDVAHLTVIECALYRGDTTESGRGEIADKNGLHRIRTNVPISHSLPHPYVEIESATFDGARRAAGGAFVVSMDLRGTVVSGLADIVPDHAADPTEVTVQIGDQTFTAPLTREDEAISLLRPYAARYRFQVAARAVRALPHMNHAQVSVTEPMTHQVGWKQVRFELEPIAAPGPSLEESYPWRWIRGPWRARTLDIGGRNPNGPFAPFLIRMIGPKEAIATWGLKARVFGVDHELIEYDDWVWSKGDSSDNTPGVFLAGGELDWQNGQTLGSGHISKQDGFVFASITQTLAGVTVPIAGGAMNVMDTALKLWQALVDLAAIRRTARVETPNNAGHTYGPGYTDGAPATDPFVRFTDWLFGRYANNGVLDADSFVTMCQHADVPPDQEPAGIPNGATAMYFEDVLHGGLPVLGSRQLLGLCADLRNPMDQENDFTDQSQNVTQILHFNNGLGWYARAMGPQLQEWIDAIGDPSLTVEQRRARLLDAILDLGVLPATGSAALRTLRTTAGDETALSSALSANPHYARKLREVTDIAICARIWGGGGSTSSLDVYIAYDMASFEGFHLFGIDSFNDCIATQAGAILGWAVMDSLPPVLLTSAADLRRELDHYLGLARLVFSYHRVFGRTPHANARSALFALMLAVGATGNFIQIREQHWNKVIWRSTIGRYLHKNVATIANPLTRDPFVAATRAHLAATEGTDWRTPMAAPYVGDPDDIEALHQVIDLLTLFNH